MSQADEEVRAARDALNEAVRRLANVVVNRCDGWDEFRNGYLDTLRESFGALIKVRDAVDC